MGSCPDTYTDFNYLPHFQHFFINHKKDKFNLSFKKGIYPLTHFPFRHYKERRGGGGEVVRVFRVEISALPPLVDTAFLSSKITKLL